MKFHSLTLSSRMPLAAAVAAVITVSAPAAFSQGLEEVLVTAQKREQGLQDVPISVEAFSAEQIDNLAAQDIGDLGIFTANVQIGRESNQPSYKIRGIGTSDFGIGADPAVGVYIDGVYIGRSGGSKVAFNDIARVEILNGPQGTLFGRNAAAGAIQYVTNKPEAETMGWVKATLGNYDRRQIEGVYNTALTDQLYFRGGVLYNERDGWIDNLSNGDDLARQKNESINGQLRWLPSDRLDIILRMEYDEIDQDSRPSSSAIFGPRDNGPAFDKVESDEVFEERRYLFGSSLHLTYDMDWATLTSITSWRSYNSRNPEEKDGSAELLYRFSDFNAEKNKQFSQEFRFSGEMGDSFLWTTGVNYSWEHAKQNSGISLSPQAVDKAIAEIQIGFPYSALPPGVPFDLAFATIPDPEGRRAYANGTEALAADIFNENIFIDAEYESYAAFADVTYDITETLSLTAGLRYTQDEKEFGRFVEFNEFLIAFGFETETRIDANGDYDPDGQLGYLVSEEDWSETTPRVVLDWRVMEDVLLYASYAEGYKAGGFNSAGEILAPAFEPESVTNYELGMKSTWFDNTLRVNAALFTYEYDDLQNLEFIQGACIPGSDFGTNLFTTSDIEGDGFELSANWLPLPALEMFFNAGYLDAEYTSRDELKVVDGECQVIDRSGEQFAEESPEISFSVGGTYTLDFSSGAQMTFSAAYNFAEGNEPRSCGYVVDNKAEGRPNDFYEFTEIDGTLVISNPSATGDLTEVPFDSCPDLEDFEQLNLRAAFLSPDGSWEVAAFMTNATDWKPDTVVSSGQPGGIGGELASNFSDGSPTYERRQEPRMYGLELRYNW
ncbi:MAG: TonB-dependent receptor [Halioglobus sp.]